MAKYKIEDVIEILKEDFDITPKKVDEDDEDEIDLDYTKKVKKEPEPKPEPKKLSEEQIKKIREQARASFRN